MKCEYVATCYLVYELNILDMIMHLINRCVKDKDTHKEILNRVFFLLEFISGMYWKS